LKELISKILC